MFGKTIENDLLILLGVDGDPRWRVDQDEPVLVPGGCLRIVTDRTDAGVDGGIGGQLAAVECVELAAVVGAEPHIVMGDTWRLSADGGADREPTGTSLGTSDPAQRLGKWQQVAVQHLGIAIRHHDPRFEFRHRRLVSEFDTIHPAIGRRDPLHVSAGNDGDPSLHRDVANGVAQRAKPALRIPAPVLGLDVGDARKCRRGAVRRRS